MVMLSSETVLRPLLDQAMPDAVFVHDHDGRFVDVNRRAAESLGYSRDELLTMNVVDIEQDFDIAAAQAEWARIDAHGNTTLLGHQRRKDGSLFPVEVHFGLLPAEAGRLYVGVVRDISERVRLAREAGKATETRHRGIIESMSEGMVLQDADGRITAVNPAAERILGLTADELMGLTSVDPRWGAVHEDGTPFPGELHPGMVALRSGRPQREQVMGIDDPRTGRRWISVNALPMVLGAGGAPDGVLATFVDITQRRLAEDRLRQSEQRFGAMFRSSQLGIGISHMSDSRLIDVNDAWLRVFGLARDEVIGRTAIELGLWPDPPLRRELMARTEAAGGVSDFEARFRHSSGDIGDLLVSSALVEIDGERCFVVMLSDITARKRMEAELAEHRDHLEALVLARTQALGVAKDAAEAADRAKSAFLANMSHELHTPLNGIMGMNELALRRATDPRQVDQLEKLKQSARRMLATVDGVLDYSRLEAERLTLAREPFPLQLVVSRLGRLFAAEAQARGLGFAIELPIELAQLTVLGDEVRLAQVLQNLVGNAVRFTSQGEVAVSVHALSRTATDVALRFDVADTGIGIAAADTKRLFHPFSQLDASASRRSEGTGLGLAICMRLARLMGGDLALESQPGVGSRFALTVSLPLAAAPAA